MRKPTRHSVNPHDENSRNETAFTVRLSEGGSNLANSMTLCPFKSNLQERDRIERRFI